MSKEINKAYIPTILLLIALAILHYLGNHFALYVRVSWYDIMMHILGGMGVSLALYWSAMTFFKDKVTGKNLWTIILVTFFVGVAWELMEAYYDIAGYPVGTLAYWLDTIKDLLDDILGAIITYLFLS